MATYFRFLLLMALGMFGVGLALTTILDTLLVDWDLGENFRRYAEGLNRRARFIDDYEYDAGTAQRMRALPVRTALPKEIRLVEAAQAASPPATPLPLPILWRPTTPPGGRRVPQLTPPLTPAFTRIGP